MQAYGAVRHAPGRHRSGNLVAPTREVLKRTGLHYVIENVVGAQPRVGDAWIRWAGKAPPSL